MMQQHEVQLLVGNAPLQQVQEQLVSPLQPAGGHSYQVSGGDVHFLPVEEELDNYVKYCTGWLDKSEMPNQKAMIKIVKKYTEGKQWFCSTINFALATDHRATLREHGMYIRHLKYCCGKMQGYSGEVYRGVDMSSKEVGQMKSLGTFYIPSFVSTSTDKDKVFSKNTLLIIDVSDAPWTLLMNSTLSKYQDSESELLISCYTKYQWMGQKKKPGEPRTVWLKALPFSGD